MPDWNSDLEFIDFVCDTFEKAYWLDSVIFESNLENKKTSGDLIEEMKSGTEYSKRFYDALHSQEMYTRAFKKYEQED